jgi:transcriptional regulator with XRE-family HTH domain
VTTATTQPTPAQQLPRVVRALAGIVFDDADDALTGAPPQSPREITAERRRMLGEFIRSRRERTTPEMVGMEPGFRRRTPGLRREEMALLSGIGITWYTWLEQGRSINVSAQVLQSVARVLSLDAAERAHLFSLAELPDPEQPAPLARVSPGVQTMVDQLAPLPAAVFGPRWEILASNRAHLGLFGDYTALPPGCRNSVWMCFMDPFWHTLLPHRAKFARRIVAKMRTAMAEYVGDPGWAALLDLMQTHSPEFRELWARHEVAPMETCYKRYEHPLAGTLNVEVSHLWLSDQRNARLMVQTPGDEQTRRGFEVLMTAPPHEIPGPPAQADSALSAG